MKAVLCPVCQGDGVVGYGVVCHGCNGKGWLEVAEEKPIDLVEELTGQKQEDWSKCPACGGDRNNPALTGCPQGSHYGTYCLPRFACNDKSGRAITYIY